MSRKALFVIALAAFAFAAPAVAQTQEGSPAMTQTLAPVLAPAGDPETARVISLVSSIPLAVDLAAYDLAEAAFAPSIVVDYTSLWGGDPQSTTPAALMDSWRGIVPGFDATFHELSNVRAVVAGDRAEATADVDGRHWIGDRLWRPIGRYHWALERQDGEWRVTAMTFTVTEEHGDRALAQEAMARAAQSAAP